MHEVCWGLCRGLEEEDQGVIRHRSPLGWTSLLYSQRRYKDMKTEDIHLKYIYISVGRGLYLQVLLGFVCRSQELQRLI